MKDIIHLIGKVVRMEYKINSENHTITGHLKSVKEDRIRIGDQWVMLVEGYNVEEVEYKGA